eukprot:m.262420 g.262420  ORF g.262420 m.262420 type:complete len:269 (-) comp45539_c0_seq1:149-955(-)
MLGIIKHWFKSCTSPKQSQILRQVMDTFRTELPQKNSIHHGTALRNRDHILEQLKRVLPEDVEGLALEIASGTGAHIEVFAPAFPKLTFQPSEYVPRDNENMASKPEIHGKIGNREGLQELECLDLHGHKTHSNVLPAVALDASLPLTNWPPKVMASAGMYSLMCCSNVTHIAPWAVTVGMFKGAGNLLAPKGHFIIYGPFKVDGKFVGPDDGASNASFDRTLKTRNPNWGYRDVAQLTQEARTNGLSHVETIAMPANNLLLHFAKLL